MVDGINWSDRRFKERYSTPDVFAALKLVTDQALLVGSPIVKNHVHDGLTSVETRLEFMIPGTDYRAIVNDLTLPAIPLPNHEKVCRMLVVVSDQEPHDGRLDASLALDVTVDRVLDEQSYVKVWGRHCSRRGRLAAGQIIQKILETGPQDVSVPQDKNVVSPQDRSF